jgi:putative ribosome biogenesis GTPase RsgA
MEHPASQPTPVPAAAPARAAAPVGALRRTAVTNCTDLTSRPAVNQLVAGDRIEVDHEVKVGLKRWRSVTTGTVVRIERRRHGLHFKRHSDDKVFSDLIIMQLADGSLSTVTIDEFTQLKRLS